MNRFDVSCRSTRPDAECSAMLAHRASFATTPMDRYGAPWSLSKLLKTYDKRADQNCPPAALKFAYSNPALQNPSCAQFALHVNNFDSVKRFIFHQKCSKSLPINEHQHFAQYYLNHIAANCSLLGHILLIPISAVPLEVYRLVLCRQAIEESC